MKNALSLVCCVTLLLSYFPLALAHPHILDISQRQEISFSQMNEELDQVDVIFIGELHNHQGHHQMQLEVIQARSEKEPDLALGLEMFRSENQGALDKWVADEMSERGFQMVFNQNWSMWPQYRDIFVFARLGDIPMVGLNVPRNLTGQVAREWFESLSADQIMELGLDGLTCNVDPEYEVFIRRALGGHGPQNRGSFERFCEAQVVWDAAMARNLVKYLDEHPDRQVIVLAGSGHSWKYGIPNQLRNIDPSLTYRVILPEIPGRVTRADASTEDADFLWLDFGPGSWSMPE